MNKTLITFLVIVIFIAAVFAVGFYINKPDPGRTALKPSNSLAKAPDFNLKNYNGNIVNLSDFSGQPIIINSWAVWCPFCIDELVDFATIQEEFKNQVTFIAIDRAESIKIAKKFTDELNISDKLVFLLDPKDSFYRSLGGFSMPETIFVDKDGFIRDHKRGPMPLEEIRQKVIKLIKN